MVYTLRFFSSKCSFFIILTYLVTVLFAFYIHGVLKFRKLFTKNNPFFTRSGQIISSSFLQHHFSKISRYFWSNFLSVQFQRHTNLCSRSGTLYVSSSNLYPSCWWRKIFFSFFLSNAAFAMAVLDLIWRVCLALFFA